jgi:hypothetical protein
MKNLERGMVAPWRGAKFVKPPCRRSWVVAIRPTWSWLGRVACAALGFLESVMTSTNLKRKVGPGLRAEERFEFESPASRIRSMELVKYI